jgi:hypothetical protein
MLDADELGESRLDHVCPLFPRRGREGPHTSCCEISMGRMPPPPAKVYRGRAVVRTKPSCKSGDLFRSANN